MQRFSLLQNDLTRCYVCKKQYNLQLHHVFEGRNRKNSDEDGCVVMLCQEHHTGNNGVHFDKHLDKILKERCENVWLKHYRKTKEDFIKRYRRNYL